MFQPLVCVVDFHHARGPEIEHCFGAGERDPSTDNDWSLIPYMALPDGAHASEEEYSYFSLVYQAHEEAKEIGERTSVFGISCIRHIDSVELLYRSEDVTRSAVQKAVVVITDQPQSFSVLREKLSAVTKTWFAQKDFRDTEILLRFQESLVQDGAGSDDDRDQYFGLSLREVVHTFKWQTLVLLKGLLLQPKMLFFGANCERICQIQFALLSLIPGLVRSLRDCADPTMDKYAEMLKQPDSVRTSDRSSLLAYMGIPLQIFGKGSIFGPYTPLQQLDTLTDLGTKSYVVGSTNSLLLQQKDRYSDILVNLDDNTVTVLSPAVRTALALSTADRRWIDFLTQAVNDTWDDSDPSRPKTHGYAGSEEFIRLQFEEYLLAMLSASKYHAYLEMHKEGNSRTLLADVDGDPASEFSLTYLDAWRETENYKLWNRTTSNDLFDIVEPRHPCAGGLTIEDVQRRLATQVAELHLDERFNQTKEVVNKRLADGRTQVTTAFNKVWADIEVMREAQRKRSDEAKAATAADQTASGGTATASGSKFSKPDLVQAQASVAAAGQRAGAYLSSWGNWANEKRKTAWRSNSGEERPKVTTVSELGREEFNPRIIRLTDKRAREKRMSMAVGDRTVSGTSEPRRSLNVDAKRSSGSNANSNVEEGSGGTPDERRGSK